MDTATYPGVPFPLGATWTGDGVNYALYADNATAVELCFFYAPVNESEVVKINLTERSYQVWHAFVPGIKPEQLYGYRVHGPFEPQNGYRYNANKLLIDPYAKAISGTI